MQAVPIPLEYLPQAWPIIEPILARAVDRVPERYAVSDVLAGAATGEFQIWAVITDEGAFVAAFTTRVQQYPRGRSMTVDFVAGDRMADWLETVDAAIAGHAAANDCGWIEAHGRKGWAKALTEIGWRATHVTYERGVNYG